MYQHEFDDFKNSMSDLCTAFNRPFTDDVVRVFWDALKAFPLQRIKARIRIVIGTAKKFPNPNEIRPEDDERPVNTGAPMHEILTTYVLRHRSLSNEQLRSTWTFLHRDGVTVGVVIPADHSAIPHRQAIRVMIEDMQLERVA